MAYQVLARKWRPHNFSELVGQQHVVTTLTHALKHQRLHHAYLFTGTRGVGKTTIARILAKAVNCENLQNNNPCGVCDICVAVDEGRFLDLIEVDAASRTKVDETRDLLDNVQYAPNRGRYKVYLIDEVHMLSGHSFNALLKTLEEPPEHVKFLLATTDPHKIPVTVLSRCLQFNLRRLSPHEISTQMAFILEQEKIDYQLEALRILSKAADGSLRDGLSLLDQAIVFGNGQVTHAAVQSMLGLIAQQPLEDLLRQLAANNATDLFKTIANIAELNPDFIYLTQELLQHFHRIALFQKLGETVDDEQTDLMAELAQAFSAEDIQLYYQIALLGQKDLPLAPSPRVGFEMLMLRMLSFRPVRDSDPRPIPAAPLSKMQAQPKIAESPVLRPSPKSSPNSEVPALSKPEVSPPAPPDSLPAHKANDNGDWAGMIKAMNLNALTLQLANNCSLELLDDQECTLLLEASLQHVNTEKTKQNLTLALQEYCQKPIRLHIKIVETALTTPAVAEFKAQEQKQADAVASIQNDPQVQTLIEKFDARILPGSIEAI